MQASASSRSITAAPLQREAYRPFGDLIAPDATRAPLRANDGAAQRHDRLGVVENLRTGATPNLCLFRVQPFRGERFTLRLLERHPHSTQVFVPMAGAGRYLVIVCAREEAPDLHTLKAFVAQAGEGITYRPGVWHHPLIALDREADFACLVHEDGSAGDCELREIVPAVNVAF